MTEAITPLAAPRADRRPLASRHFPALGPVEADPIVLLHGWGSDSESWRPLIAGLRELGEVITVDLPGFGASPPLAEFNLDALLQQLEDSLPAGATLMGWSLGGMLAIALAERCPSRVGRVVTLASNLSFVAQDSWPEAMAERVYRDFRSGFEADPQGTLRRFVGLMARGADDERALLKQLRAQLCLPEAFNSSWQDSLALLGGLDNRAAFARLKQPGLHIFGAADALVPLAAAGGLPPINPRQRIEVISGAGHALHWSHPQQVLTHLARFLRATAGQLDKRRVASSFSRAAASYDSVARLQRAVSEQLLNFLPPPDNKPDFQLLDLGCGTGYVTEQLARRQAPAQVLGLDLAEGMLQFARRERSGITSWLCADAEALPLASESVDLVYSSLSIQWCEQLPQLFDELRRVLKPGGELLFSTLGPRTLWELKAAWQQVDGFVHVNRFQPQAGVEAALFKAGFGQLQWQREERVLRYREVSELTRELKALGAHNVNRGQPEGLTGRRKIMALKEAYERYRSEGLLPASYEVYYCRATLGPVRNNQHLSEQA